MADFSKGFVFETGVSAGLTIEGNPVRGFRQRRPGGRASAVLPSGVRISGENLKELVENYVTKTGLLKGREDTRMEHLSHLREGRAHWNRWRRQNPGVQPMLAEIKVGRDFTDRALDGYDFSYANFTRAKLRRVTFRRANFHQAILAGADLTGAHLEGANFCRTDFYETNFTGAHLTGANLQGVQLARTILAGADLRGCTVYGMSAWDLDLQQKTKHDRLTIKYQSVIGGSEREEDIIVDGLDLAAFIYSTLNNRNIARIIDGASRKWVLILGRFTDQRKHVLEKLRDTLKDKQYIPIIFDFQRPDRRDLVETLMLLAGMSAFVIVDISAPRSTPLELQAIASNYGVPIFPILKGNANAFGMFPGLRKFRWVFPVVRYRSPADLVSQLHARVIGPAEREAERLRKWKRRVER